MAPIVDSSSVLGLLWIVIAQSVEFSEFLVVDTFRLQAMIRCLVDHIMLLHLLFVWFFVACMIGFLFISHNLCIPTILTVVHDRVDTGAAQVGQRPVGLLVGLDTVDAEVFPAHAARAGRHPAAAPALRLAGARRSARAAAELAR